MGHYLGIDLGGTNIVAGLVDEQYNITCKSDRPTVLKRSRQEIIADMAACAMDVLRKAGLSEGDLPYVGIGMPSSIDAKTKRVVFANNLGWKDADVVDEFHKHMDLPLFIANDADCAALGECMAGAGRDFDSIIMITLGTGVGGGIVLNKKLFLGGDGFGIEPGHTILIHDGFLCTCGRKGCLEAYASVLALIRQTTDMMMVYPHSLMWEECGHDLNKVEGRTAFDAAKRGDAPAKEVVDQYISYLAGGLASMVTGLRPQAIIVGGGVSGEGDYLLNPLRDIVSKTIYAHDVLATPPILKAQLGNNAGLIGAALLGLEPQEVAL